MANLITTPGPYRLLAGRAIVDAQDRLIATCHARRKVGQDTPHWDEDGGIGPCEADDNARLLTRAWTMRAALQAARLAFQADVGGYYCQVCSATAPCLTTHVHGVSCVPLTLTDHAQDCAYRAVVEALEGIE